jgi:hypothetical protein
MRTTNLSRDNQAPGLDSNQEVRVNEPKIITTQQLRFAEDGMYVRYTRINCNIILVFLRCV